MEKKTEKRAVEQILRRLGSDLQSLGFRRTKPRYFIRARGDHLDLIHVHKYSFESGFRIHLAIRALADPFEAIALNGPDSHGACSMDLSFRADDQSVEMCAARMADFCRRVGEKWFDRWASDQHLISAPDSPLSLDAHEALVQAISGNPSAGAEAQTRALLGLA